jgi:hypothetical protein
VSFGWRRDSHGADVSQSEDTAVNRKTTRSADPIGAAAE